jgi:hypothetical protein
MLIDISSRWYWFFIIFYLFKGDDRLLFRFPFLCVGGDPLRTANWTFEFAAGTTGSDTNNIQGILPRPPKSHCNAPDILPLISFSYLWTAN